MSSWREGTAERQRGAAFRIDVDRGTAEPLPAHGNDVVEIALDPGGTVVATGSADGTVRVGRVSREEPHILFGQPGWIRSLAFSPDGRWLVASGDSPKIYIWPVPDMSKVPLPGGRSTSCCGHCAPTPTCAWFPIPRHAVATP